MSLFCPQDKVRGLRPAIGCTEEDLEVTLAPGWVGVVDFVDRAGVHVVISCGTGAAIVQVYAPEEVPANIEKA